MALLTPAELVRIAGLRPQLRAAVLPMMQAIEDATGKKVTVPPHGGLRTRAQQQALWDARGTNPFPVAAPGNSRHEFGGAVDLDIIGGTENDYALMADIVQHTFGMVSLYPDDPVHVQLDESLNEAIDAWTQLQRGRVRTAALVAGIGLAALILSRESETWPDAKRLRRSQQRA